MARPKPKWGSKYPSFHKHLPDQQKLEKFFLDIEKNIEKSLSNSAKETIRRLIILIETKKSVVYQQPNKEELKEEVRQTKMNAEALLKVFSETGFSEKLRDIISMNKITEDLTDELDPTANLEFSLIDFLSFWEVVENDVMDIPSSPHSLSKFRNEVIIELARVYEELGLKPSSTKFSPFESFIELFLDFVGLSLSSPHNAIRKAISQYPNTPRMSLLGKP